VARRRPELGIRLALGARPGHVASTIVRQTMTPAALGLLLGLPLALVVARTAEQMLFGLSALDPATYASAAAVLLVVATAASVAPARRAAAIDPIESIRSE
jgi:ABC-type antimicrobial peptide transport system permease subunit